MSYGVLLQSIHAYIHAYIRTTCNNVSMREHFFSFFFFGTLNLYSRMQIDASVLDLKLSFPQLQTTHLPSKSSFRSTLSQKAQIVSVEHGPDPAFQFRAHVSVYG